MPCRTPRDLWWRELWKCCVEENSSWRHRCCSMPLWRNWYRVQLCYQPRKLIWFKELLTFASGIPWPNLLIYSFPGLVLRRCTLDAIGLALWGNPSYIKCVSREYQNIQALVRLHISTDHYIFCYKKCKVVKSIFNLLNGIWLPHLLLSLGPWAVLEVPGRSAGGWCDWNAVQAEDDLKRCDEVQWGLAGGHGNAKKHYSDFQKYWLQCHWYRGKHHLKEVATWL